MALEHDCTMDVDGFCHGCEELVQGRERIVAETLFTLESEIRFAIEHSISLKEIGKAIIRGLGKKGLKQGINKFLLVAELTK